MLGRHWSPEVKYPTLQGPHTRPAAVFIAGGGRSVQPFEKTEHGKSIQALILEQVPPPVTAYPAEQLLQTPFGVHARQFKEVPEKT